MKPSVSQPLSHLLVVRIYFHPLAVIIFVQLVPLLTSRLARLR